MTTPKYLGVQIWQMNLCLANGPPCYHSRNALHTSTQILADEPTLADGPPQYQSRDALHTSTHNLADDPTLADGPPSTRAEMPWIPVHKTWQMNLLWPMDPTLYQSRDAFTLLLTSCGQEWQFDIATDI